MHNLSIAILSFGIFQSGLLSVALLRRKHQHPSNIFLVFFVLVIALQLTFKVVSKDWLWYNVRTIYMISYNYGYLIGPLIYLFFRSQRTGVIFKKTDWLHFLPFVIRTIQTLFDEVFGIIYYLPFNNLFPWPSLQIASMICYGVFAWRSIGKGNRPMKQFLIVVIAVESIIMLTIIYLVNNNMTAPDLRPVFLILTGLIFWITYLLVSSPDVFTVQREIPMLKLVTSAATKYANSGLRNEEQQSILAALKHAIDKEQIFLQPDITIDHVAQKLAVSKHHLSQVINQNFGHSFTELVGNWRLDEAQRRLLSPAHRGEKISAIAFDLGFNSVSVFNTAFKRRFKTTPSAFRSEGMARRNAAGE